MCIGAIKAVLEATATMIMDRENLKKYCAVLGVHFAMAPLSFLWIYGNLSAYLDSYFRFACSPGCLDGDSQWILCLYVAGQTPGVLLVRLSARRLGLKWTGLVSMAICNLALLCSAWSLRMSVTWTAALFGILVGPCAAVNYTLTLYFINGWAPEKTAFLMATSTSFPTILSVLQNQIITAYVNPNNLKAVNEVGSKTYFDQPQILNRVPEAVFIFAVMTFGFQLIGYTLISNPPEAAQDVSTNAATTVQTQALHTALDDDNGTKTMKSLHNFHSHDMNSYGSNDPSQKKISDIHHKEHNHPSLDQTSGCREKHPKLPNDTPVSYKPSEMLRLPAFHALFCFGMAMEFGLLLKSNFYKQFAQIYIQDDRYLTMVGTLIPITSICSRVAFGTLLDKGVLTIKDVTVFALSVHTVLSAIWYLIPQVSAVLYLFLILGLAFAQSIYFIVGPCAVLRLFGPEHLSTNYALAAGCMLVISILTPFVVSPMLHAFGWFWLFASCSIFNLFTLCLVVSVSFETQRRIKLQNA